MLLTMALVPVSPADAGTRLVTANLHPAVVTQNCSAPPDCLQATPGPLSNLGDFDLLAGGAYHVGRNCNAAVARCQHAHYSRTKILSSDVSGTDPLNVLDWIEDTRQSPHQTGQIHFEHFDKCLSEWTIRGHFIGDLSTFPPVSAPGTWCRTEFNPPVLFGPREMLVELQTSASVNSLTTETRLRQNGTLHSLDSEPRKLKWLVHNGTAFVDENKRLMGFGHMGTLVAGDKRVDADAFFRTLREHNVNFTRVWSVEQWTGASPLADEGLTPFAGSLAGDFNLGADNPAFYDRLRRFAQAAADRGIGVQLSLFDKHGLLFPDGAGAYRDSPYKNSNNTQPFIRDTWPAGQTCGSGVGSPGDFAFAPNCTPLYDFLGMHGEPNDAAVSALHRRYLRRVGEEAGAIGNMMFEVINEALAPSVDSGGTPHPGDWAAKTGGVSWNETWQKEMVRQMRLSLPIDSANGRHAARDAFNGETSYPVVLNGKVLDVDGPVWHGENAGVRQEKGGVEGGTVNTVGPDRTFGYATSNGFATHSKGWVEVSFGSPAVNWTKQQVRADVTCLQGLVRLGFETASGAKIYTQVDCGAPGADDFVASISLIEEVTPGVPVVRWWMPGWSINEMQNLRVRVRKSAAGALTAEVYRDGELLPQSETSFNEGSSFAPEDYSRAFYWASNGNGQSVPPDVFKVDNFEVARFCDDANRGCAP